MVFFRSPKVEAEIPIRPGVCNVAAIHKCSAVLHFPIFYPGAVSLLIIEISICYSRDNSKLSRRSTEAWAF